MRQKYAAGAAVADDRDVFDGVVFGTELVRLSSWAYRAFRRQFNQTGGLVTAARGVRDVTLRAAERARGLRAYDHRKNHQVDSIEFVGVWDTVDAYGLPVDELTQGVDRWVWPLSMPDLTLSDKVQRACHVLALDDERNTFHPVLWDESREPQTEPHIAAERISQVWFAGMHSNVGGGYPDDALAYVSLKWMTEQAAARQLQFVPALLHHHTAKADPFGRVYDSRNGLKAYYRYNPRRIEWLTNRQAHEYGMASPVVGIARPKIHESVFTRMAAAPEAYAPIVLPEHYAVVMDDGRILEGDDNPYEPAAAAARRARAQEACWDLVWQRRAVYFAAVAASLFLLGQPLRAPVENVNTIEMGLVARGLEAMRSFVPGFASRWITYYQAHPWQLVIVAGIILVLRSRGRQLKGRICGTMRAVWLKVIPPAAEEWKRLRRGRSWLTAVRLITGYQVAFAVLRRKILPNVFGILILVGLIGAANRAPFEALNVLGFWCDGSGGRTLAVNAPSAPVPFASAAFCAPTGIRLEAGARYRLDLTGIGDPGWRDHETPVSSPGGFTTLSSDLSLRQRALFAASVPFRRVWSENWFVPIARVGDGGLEHYPLDLTSKVITAKTSNELFLFVNDSIAPLGLTSPWVGWKSAYANNHGVVYLTVTKLADPVLSSASR
jgi:hypothetical protein